MSNTVSLEDFRSRSGLEESSDVAAIERRAGYQTGFDDGFAAAEHLLMLEQSKMSAQILEDVRDAQLTQLAAREAVVAEIGPLLGAVINALAPQVADATLVATATARANKILSANPDAALVIEAPEKHLAALSHTLADTAPVSRGDSDRVKMHWSHGFDQISPDDVAGEIMRVVSEFFGFEEDDSDERTNLCTA